MKKLILFVLLALPWPLTGRIAPKDWTFQEMFAKSDLVVIAAPIATFETQEHTALKDIAPLVDVLGLSTEFQVLLPLKGDQAMKKFVLHHCRLEHEEAMVDMHQSPSKRTQHSIRSFN